MAGSRVSVYGRQVAGAVLLSGAAWLVACGSSHRDADGDPRGLGTGGVGGAQGGAAGKGGASGRGGSAAHGGTGGDIVAPPEGGGGAGDNCRRDVSLTAVTLGEPPPFDLVIVADHSQSLAWSRDELVAGLHDLLTNVEGRAVRVFLLTPTQYGAASEPAKEPLLGTPVVPWQDPATGQAYQDAATTYSQTCTDPTGKVIDCPSPLGPDPYHVVGTWSFVMPDPIAELTPTMTAAEFATQQQAVADAILAIGGTGSPHEEPLCTLSRYITQGAAALPKNAVFLVISDEDDVSKPVDCLAGFTGDVNATMNENGTSPCSAGCDAYRFQMTGTEYFKGFPFTCAAYDDLGKLIAGSETMLYASQGQLSSCAGIESGPCTDDEKKIMQVFCESGKVVESCSRECSQTDGLTCKVDLHDAGVNACTQSFSFNGQTYANLAAYCATIGSGWHDCSGGGIDIQYSQNLSGGSSLQPLTPGSTTADIGKYFRTHADAAFGPSAYKVEAIVFEPEFGCPLQAGQSYAANLATFVADPSSLFPLCKPYAPALSGVLTFAQTLIQTKYQLTLMDDEDVTDVVVMDGSGNERTLGSDQYHYDRTTGVLTIDPNALRSSDKKLRVEVTSDCRPIVK